MLPSFTSVYITDDRKNTDRCQGVMLIRLYSGVKQGCAAGEGGGLNRCDSSHKGPGSLWAAALRALRREGYDN